MSASPRAAELTPGTAALDFLGLALAIGCAGCGSADAPAPVVTGEVRGAPLLAAPEALEAAAEEPHSAQDPTADEPAPDELAQLDWEFLGDYEYRLPNARAGERPEDMPPDQIPAEVLAYDGREVELEGYMLVSRFAHGQVLGFELSRHYMGCCFGRAPRLNEWVVIDVPEGVEARIGATMRVRGQLEVGELAGEDGWVESVYRMRAESIDFD